MEIKKSLFVLLRNLIFIVLLMSFVLIFLNYLKHFTGLYKNATHNEIFNIDLITLILPIFITFLAFILTTLRWKSEGYFIEGNLLVYKHGILNKQIRHYPIENIESISFDQGFIGKILNYGSVYLVGSTKHKNILIHDIDDPVRCYKYLKKFIAGDSKNSLHNQSLDEIIKKGEDDNIEFKSSFRWDLRQNKVNKDLEKTIMKTIAGFMNSTGGILIIGIDDEGNALGLKGDYNTFQRKTADGFANHFTQTFDVYIGLEYRYLVRIDIQKLEDRDVCIVHIDSSKMPIYLKDDKLNEFYVRTGNSTNMLNVREANTYIKLHWA